MATSKQRREAARRQLERQLQVREERAAARRRVTLVASIVGTIVLIVAVTVFIVAISGGDKKKTATGDTSNSAAPSTSAAEPTSAAPLPLGTCKFVAGGTATKKVALPPDQAPTTDAVLAQVATTQGVLTFSLDRSKAPCAVQNFLSLAQQGYYDNTPCSRVVTTTPAVLQCGDPTGTGSGNPGYTFNDELTGKEKYTTGVLAMANSGANTNGSQFFIVYKDSTLQPNYTIFGKVTGGMSVVDKVAAKGSDNSRGQGDGKPKLPITITTVTIAN